MEENGAQNLPENVKQDTRRFSAIGFSFFALLAFAVLLRFLIEWALKTLGWADSALAPWLMSAVPSALALPVCALLLRRIPAERIEGERLRTGDWFVFLLISICAMYAGNLIGSSLISGMENLTGKPAFNPLESLIFKSNPWITLLFVCIVAPPLEELVFRKLLIDRLRRYGGKTALFVSALIFALAHGNVYQFFYAFALGTVFAYVYLKTGRVRYTIFLHSVINSFSGVVLPMLFRFAHIESLQEFKTLPQQAMFELVQNNLLPILLIELYTLAMLGAAIAGLVLLIGKRKQIRWEPGTAPLPKGMGGHIVFGNAGMFCFVAVSLVMLVLAANA